MLPQNFLFNISVDSLGARVPTNHSAIGIEHDDGVVAHPLHQRVDPPGGHEYVVVDERDEATLNELDGQLEPDRDRAQLLDRVVTEHGHLHLSAWDGDRNIFDDPSGETGLSDVARAFLGGLLAHARGMAAVCAPTVNAYKRFVAQELALNVGATGPRLERTDTRFELAGDRDVRIRFLPRDEADQDPSLIRTKVSLLPASLREVRVVDIVGLDRQADGGTHVGSTTEVGAVRIAKVESKGKGFRRIRLSLDET
jgi:hypothetical protein